MFFLLFRMDHAMNVTNYLGIFNSSTFPEDYALEMIAAPLSNGSGHLVNHQILSTSSSMDSDVGTLALNATDPVNDIPIYLRVTCLILLVTIFFVGTVGNVLVIVVISCSRDMRTSTNIYLVNLSLADLLLLLVCTPTALIEICYHPEIWILGFHMCEYLPIRRVNIYTTYTMQDYYTDIKFAEYLMRTRRQK